MKIRMEKSSGVAGNLQSFPFLSAFSFIGYFDLSASADLIPEALFITGPMAFCFQFIQSSHLHLWFILLFVLIIRF